MDRIKMRAMAYLYGQQKKAKVALGQAESKKGVTSEELSSLIKRLEVLDWLIGLAIKED